MYLCIIKTVTKLRIQFHSVPGEDMSEEDDEISDAQGRCVCALLAHSQYRESGINSLAMRAN